MKNIIFSSDLNGNITPSSSSVWNWSNYLYRQSQNNIEKESNSLEITTLVTEKLFKKNATTMTRFEVSAFSPIIEFRE